MTWRNCGASVRLLEAVNARWPNRSKASDGTIGDTSHQAKASASDHNPNAQGIVRARDITANGIDAPWLVEHLRQLGVSGDHRLVGGGYLIFNRRITKPDFSGWSVYAGANPHVSHAHVSFSRSPAGYDSQAAWALGSSAPAAPEGIFMALTDAEQRDILEAARSLLFGRAGVRPAGQVALLLDDTRQNLLALRSQVANLQHVDSKVIAAEVAEAITAAGIAGPVIDELSRRLGP